MNKAIIYLAIDQFEHAVRFRISIGMLITAGSAQLSKARAPTDPSRAQVRMWHVAQVRMRHMGRRGQLVVRQTHRRWVV